MSSPIPPPARPLADGDSFDVVVIGGAFAGGAFATLLGRLRPGARVLVIEERQRFDRKVGEATVEVSAFFLHRALGLYDLLSRGHLPKHGLRYWFADGPERPLAEMSEVGSRQLPRLPAFQLDRSELDEQLLELAAAGGARIERPARVTDVEHGWPHSRVRLATAGGERWVSARWVVDASGRHAFLARRLRLRRRVEEHPTAAAWARWQGVADFDGPAVVGDDPRQPRLTELPVARRLATNHFCGYGWWCWTIPLAGGRTSVGLVWDKRLFTPPGDGPLEQRYRDFVTRQAGLRELLADAEMDGDDFLSYSHLPYTTERYADPGWALVGDAAGFMDPYYSPGLDHASISVYATARLIEDDLAGRLAGDGELARRIDDHNDRFLRSYQRWLSALYLGKYEILGDAELTGAAYLVDTAAYYLGVVGPLQRDVEALGDPVLGFSHAPATACFLALRAFNRRLNRLARFRRQAGTYGRRNVGWHLLGRPPGLHLPAVAMLLKGLRVWLRVEAEYLGHRLLKGRPDVSRPVAAVAGPEPAP